jgi:dCTP diphosphatase
MNVKALQARLAAHAVERNWDPFFSPRSLSMALAGEAGALLAVFQWLSEDQARGVARNRDMGMITESLSDVVLYALRLAETLEIELEEAVAARAAEKYPVSARRFEGVEEPDSPAEAVASRPPPPAASSAPAQAAPPQQRAAADADRASTRAAPAPERPATDTGRTPMRPAPVSEEASPAGGGTGRAPPSGAIARERADAPQRSRADPAPRGRVEPPQRERAAPPPRAATPPRAAAPPRAATPPRPEAPARGERYANLDTNAVLDMMKTLNKRIDDSRSDEAILREVKDEIDTLRRNVYSSKSKPAWIAGGLERLRTLLEEAAGHPVGDKINFKDYIARIGRLLEE